MLAIVTWKLVGHVHGDNFMMERHCLRNVMSTPSGMLHVVNGEHSCYKATKWKLTAAEIAALLEASSNSDFDDTEFDDSDDE